MSGSRQIVYWDTCIFISWLAGDKSGTEMDGLKECISKIHRRQTNLITSTLTLTEILPCKFPVGIYQQLEELLKRSNISLIAVDRKIANLARDLRAYYDSHPVEDNKTISIPDSIHLATAIMHNVSEFHTFDSGKKDKKHLGLLKLDGDVGGNNLKICKPPAAPQLTFDLKIGDEI